MRQAENGYVEFSVLAKGDTLELIDWLANENGLSRSTIAGGLLDLAISLVSNVSTQAHQMLTDGATTDDIQQFMRDAYAARKPSTQKKAKTNVINTEATPLK